MTKHVSKAEYGLDILLCCYGVILHPVDGLLRQVDGLLHPLDGVSCLINRVTY